jgi:hypothetical protein
MRGANLIVFVLCCLLTALLCRQGATVAPFVHFRITVCRIRMTAALCPRCLARGGPSETQRVDVGDEKVLSTRAAQKMQCTCLNVAQARQLPPHSLKSPAWLTDCHATATACMEWKWVCLQVWEYSECLAEMDHACTLAAVHPVRVQWAPAETPQATIARSDLYSLHADCLPDSLLVRDSMSPLNPHALNLCGGFGTQWVGCCKLFLFQSFHMPPAVPHRRPLVLPLSLWDCCLDSRFGCCIVCLFVSVRESSAVPA